MARQNRTKAEGETSTTEEAPTTEQTPAEGTTPEAKPDEKPVDLTAFKESVAAAIAEGDKSTGELPETVIATVNEQYRAVEGNKGKSAARTYLQDQMLEAVGKLDAPTARGYSDLSAKLTAAGGSKADKAPADPKAAFVQKLTAVRLAYDIVAAQLPEGVDQSEVMAEVAAAVEAAGPDVVKMNEWIAFVPEEGTEKLSAPEVSSVVRQAFKLASGKASGSRSGGATASGPRKSTAPHILSAFEDKEVGTFLTIAEIANHKSAEYGDEAPSQGAVSARLFPTSGKCTLEGIEPVEKGAVDGKNPKGARKVA